MSIPDSSDYKSNKHVCPKDNESRKGVGIGRHNSHLLSIIDDQERLCLKIATDAYSLDRTKMGVEKEEVEVIQNEQEKIKLEDKLNKVSRIKF